MLTSLKNFEYFCRNARALSESFYVEIEMHPFHARNIYRDFPPKVKRLFDDGHYSESTFEALKYLDKTIQKLTGSKESGQKLMMSVFGGDSPALAINELSSESEKDEQKGYQFIFAGVMSAIRNPKGHEYSLDDDRDTCLDHLALISALLRRLESAGIIAKKY